MSATALAGLLCAGCDQAVTKRDAIVPRRGLDFCQRCAVLAWKHWLLLPEALPFVGLTVPRGLRRKAFRAWVRAHPDVFMTFTGRASR